MTKWAHPSFLTKKPTQTHNQSINQVRKIETSKRRPKKKTKTMSRSLHPHFTDKTSIFSLRLSSIFFFLSSATIHGGVRLTGAHVFIYAGCSQEKFQPNSAFESSLNSLLASTVNSAPQSSYNSFAVGNTTSASPDAEVYGLYQCRGDLKTVDCSRCVQSAVSQISLVCPYSYGAGLQLESCYIRYW